MSQYAYYPRKLDVVLINRNAFCPLEYIALWSTIRSIS